MSPIGNSGVAWAEERRSTFARSLAPNFHEWDAVMDEQTPLDGWQAIRASTLLVRARDTARPIAELAALLGAAFPHWQSATLAEGGHTAPITRPDLVNPLVRRFLTAEPS